MRILFVGDVMGSVGREMIFTHLASIKKEKQVDLVICNAENSAHGKGITKKIYNQLLEHGVDVMTMGNHTFSKKELINYIDELDYLVRPDNMEPLEYGKSVLTLLIHDKKVAIVNLCGAVFMDNVVESPFKTMESILSEIDADIVLVDLHAEATSEKIAFTYQFADRCCAIVGTHTHVQTADERIVKKHCAAISDLGMCGPYHSVIGRDIDEILDRFVNEADTKFTMATGEGIFCAALVDVDESDCKAVRIERIQIRPDGY